MNKNNSHKVYWLFGLLGLLLMVDPAFASATGMPWEGPLESIQKSLSGPVAMSIAIIGIFVGGVTLIYGGEMNEFARRIVMLVFVVALMVLGSQILGSLFGVSSAVI